MIGHRFKNQGVFSFILREVTMDREDIPEVLFSSIKEDDPYRASKLLQIERWCCTHSKIIERSGQKGRNLLAQVLSDKESWEEVGGLHGVKLNRRKVGRKFAVPDSDNSFSRASRYKISCECCLEGEIRAIFEERKEELSAQGNESLLEYHHLVRCCGEGPIAQFWSHFISGYLDKLDLRGRHPYEYGLDCAVGWRRVEAVEFFWSKIKSLPENEMSAQKKDEILMKNAVYSAGPNFRIYPDIFEFFFDQINTDRYLELLKRDLEKNGHYGSLNRIKDVLSFDKFQELFDCLKPSDISEDCYHTRLCSIEIQNYSGHYVDAAENLFIHMWMKEEFGRHRAFVIKEEVEEVIDPSTFFDRNLLVHWAKKGCMKAVWAVLNELSSDQRVKQVNYIHSILAMQGDSASLDRFSAYCNKFTDKEPYREDVPGPSSNLTEAKVEKPHGQSRIE